MTNQRLEGRRVFLATATEAIRGIEIQKPLVEGSEWVVVYHVHKDNLPRRIIGKGPTYWHALEDVADKASKMGLGQAQE